MKRKKNTTAKKKNNGVRKINKVTENSDFYIVCIGASAGGSNAISELVLSIPPTINAAFLIVLHLAKNSLPEILLSRLQNHTELLCKIAEHEELIQKGTIYLAPADRHFLVKDNKIILGDGPPENRFRPSIDILFRSVAVAYREKAIGVILTGLLNDGTIGMGAIKKCNGYTMVQDPNQAEFPDMPLAVIEHIQVNDTLPLSRLAEAIIKKTEKPAPAKLSEPEAIIRNEAELSEKMATSLKGVEDIGENSVYSCPDCGGGLWEINKGGVKHYRCHIGHAYLEEELVKKQGEEIEQTLWMAVRMLEEKKNLLSRIATQHINKGLKQLSEQYRKQSIGLEFHIQKMKDLLFSIKKD